MPADIATTATEVGLSPEKLAEYHVQKQAEQQAMAEPLPGSVKEAIAGRVPIKVGKYSVRPCFDGDIEYLSMLDHPLNELRLQTAAISATDPDERKKQFDVIWNKFVESSGYRGPMAWALCYVLTHTLDEVDEVFERGGLDSLRIAAKKEFSRVGPREVSELTPVCVGQYLRSWNSMLGYESADDDSGSKKNSSTLPGHSMMASA
jgi:hypothetical protein